MFQIPLDEINLTHLQALSDNGVAEGTQLEYKEELPRTDDEGKKEFLCDVSAMANASGGDLVYGMRERRGEDGGYVVELSGLSAVDFDATKLWMESLVRDCVKPRLVIGGIRQLTIDNSRVVLIVRVSRSWNAPHVVEFKKHWRFYSRNSAGKYPLDVGQLRDAFAFGDSLAQRAEAFRVDRLAKIVADPGLKQGAKMVIHLQPFESLKPVSEVDSSRAVGERDLMMLAGYSRSQSNLRHNFDGLLATLGDGSHGYLQLFDGGAVEEVDADILVNTKGLIPSFNVECWIITGVGRRLLLLRKLGAVSPIMVQLTLLGVKGYRMLLEDQTSYPRDIAHWQEFAEANPIDKSDLVFRSLAVDPGLKDLEGTTVDNGESLPNHWLVAAQLMRSVIDNLARSMGMPRSPHYDRDGKRSNRIEF
jgi:hypothetical protein